MISDAVPESAGHHVVLIETSARDDDHRWRLSRTIPVEGGRAAALAHARDLAMEYVPVDVQQNMTSGGTAGRKVFRISDGSWLVEIWGVSKRVMARITTAEQVYVQKYARPQ